MHYGEPLAGKRAAQRRVALPKPRLDLTCSRPDRPRRLACAGAKLEGEPLQAEGRGGLGRQAKDGTRKSSWHLGVRDQSRAGACL